MSPLEGLAPASPLAGAASTEREPIIEITPAALAKLLELRDSEPDGEQLGLRLEIASAPGEDFRYDLSFDEYLTAAFTDEVRTHEGLKVIVPQRDLEALQGATLDHTETQGLVIRNPNRPGRAGHRGTDRRRRAVGRDRGAWWPARSTRRWPRTAASSPTSATTARARPT